MITNSTEEDIEISIKPSDVLVCYDRLTLLNVEHSPTTVKLGFKGGNNEFILAGIASPGANVPFSVSGKFFAPAYYRPFARFTGATVGDKVSLYVYGYITDMPD
jgi:hypothetical protein